MWGEFNSIINIIAVRGAAYHKKERYTEFMSSVFTYLTETWVMKAEKLHGLERTEHYDGEMAV